MTDQTSYAVRAACVGDHDSLATMRLRLQQCLEQESPNLWRMAPARKAALPDFYARSIADSAVQVLIAEVCDQGVSHLAGTATGRIEAGRDLAHFGSIEDVWVEPKYRGRGIARALIFALADFFRTRGVHELTVGFIHGGTAAGLWRRLGFTPTIVIANSDVDTVQKGALPR